MPNLLDDAALHGDGHPSRAAIVDELVGKLSQLGVGLGQGARQNVLRAFAHDRLLAAGRFESGQQPDLSLGPAHFIPRDPEAIGMAQVGLAVVFVQLVGQEDEFFLGHGHVRIFVGGVEGVDGKGPVDFDRLALALDIEHHPPAQAAHARPARLTQHGVGPDVGHVVGRQQLRFGACPLHVGPGEAVA